MRTATIRVPGLKVAVPLKPDQLPRDLVPPEPAPVGEPVIELVLEGGLMARAKINGKNYRRMLKQIAEQGAEHVVIILQGTLKPPAAKGGPYALEGAGFQYTVKAPKPAGSVPEPPAS